MRSSIRRNIRSPRRRNDHYSSRASSTTTLSPCRNSRARHIHSSSNLDIVPGTTANTTTATATMRCLPSLSSFPSTDRNKNNRKKDMPTTTRKHYTRHYVVHNYHDFSAVPRPLSRGSQQYNSKNRSNEEDHPPRLKRGGVMCPFPTKLHHALQDVEAMGLSDIFGWQPHGRCFIIRNPKAFVKDIIPK